MIDEIKTKIINGKTKEAIHYLLNNLPDSFSEFKNELILMSSSYSNFEGMKGLTIDMEYWSLKTNQIASSLLELLDKIESQYKNFIPVAKKRNYNKERNIIFLGSNPVDTTRLAIDIESREISRILRRSKGNYNVIKEFAVTMELLRELILEEAPQIIHFSGHATSFGLVFHNNNDYTEILMYEDLEPILKNVNIECIILNTQNSKLFAKKLKQIIPFCIGTNSKVSYESRISFSTAFYTSLAYGKEFEEAFQISKTGLREDKEKFELF